MEDVMKKIFLFVPVVLLGLFSGCSQNTQPLDAKYCGVYEVHQSDDYRDYDDTSYKDYYLQLEITQNSKWSLTTANGKLSGKIKMSKVSRGGEELDEIQFWHKPSGKEEKVMMAGLKTGRRLDLEIRRNESGDYFTFDGNDYSRNIVAKKPLPEGMSVYGTYSFDYGHNGNNGQYSSLEINSDNTFALNYSVIITRGNVEFKENGTLIEFHTTGVTGKLFMEGWFNDDDMSINLTIHEIGGDQQTICRQFIPE